jgi:hypothetical protein
MLNLGIEEIREFGDGRLEIAFECRCFIRVRPNSCERGWIIVEGWSCKTHMMAT